MSWLAKDLYFRHYKPFPGDVIFDIGAGKGEDLEDFAQAVWPGPVFAFEACRAHYRELLTVINDKKLENVHAYHVAVMGDNCIVRVRPDSRIWEATYVDVVNPEAQGDDVVQGITLDSFMRQEFISGVSFVKMNIEGAEGDAIRAMSLAAVQARAMVIEAHDFRAERGHGDRFRTGAAVLGYLTAAGFKTEHDPEHDNYYGWR